MSSPPEQRTVPRHMEKLADGVVVITWTTTTSELTRNLTSYHPSINPRPSDRLVTHPTPPDIKRDIGSEKNGGPSADVGESPKEYAKSAAAGIKVGKHRRRRNTRMRTKSE